MLTVHVLVVIHPGAGVLVGGGSLGRGLDLVGRGFAGGGLPMSPQSGRADVGFGTGAARERPLVGVQPLVQFKMHVLSESVVALVATVRLLAGMQPHVGLQVGSGAESFAAFQARVRFFA